MYQFLSEGKGGKEHILVETSNLFIVRSKDKFDPIALFDFPSLAPYQSRVKQVDYYPEASVYVYRIDNGTIEERDQLKLLLRALNHTQIQFIGTVLQRQDNGIYQIYTGNLFIKFKNGTTKKDREAFMALHNLTMKMELHFSVNAFFIEVPPEKGKGIFELSRTLLAEKMVELCQPELVVKRKTFTKSKQLERSEIYDDWAAKMINLYEAWKVTKGKDVKICIIDDGIELDHPSFANGNRMIKTRDMFDNSANSVATHKDESEMHGTACVSIAAGNDAKIIGIAPDADLLVVRSKGLGSVLESEAIYWAVNNGADIISCSWGPSDGNIQDASDNFNQHPLPDHTRLALDHAVKKGRNGMGCLVFFAAGNGSEPIDYDGYASSDNVMAVGAVNKNADITLYSDYGSKLFCCFPSSEVMFNGTDLETIYGLPTIDRLGNLGYSNDDYYAFFGGTSAACPGMSGVAALLLSARPGLSLTEYKEMIKAACFYPPSSEQKYYEKKLGNGIIDAGKLINDAIKNTTIIKTTNQLTMSTTSKKIAIHVAVDILDDKVYKGEYQNLGGCKNDLELFKAYTTGSYSQKLFIDQDAKRNNIIKYLDEIIDECKSGDEIVFTYSGHGGSYDDKGGDEKDKKDECLVLHDGLWMDDEIYDLHQRIPAGVKVFWYTDSCHSGTSTRSPQMSNTLRSRRSDSLRSGGNVKYRQIETSILKLVFEANQTEYRNKLNSINRKQGSDRDYNADIIHFATCQDTQFAAEINGYGLCTKTLFDILKKNSNLSIKSIFNAVNAEMPASQKPKLNEFGKNTTDYLNASFLSKGDGKASDTEESKKEARTTSNILKEKRLIVVSGKANKVKNKKVKSLRGANALLAEEEVGKNIWDAAYESAITAEEDVFLEPDLTSNIYAYQEEFSENRGSTEEDLGYLTTYPHPNEDNRYEPLWHLSEDHSQLKKARESVLQRELLTGEDSDGVKYPLIVHIDTGILSDGKLHPKNLDRNESKNFKDIEDKDKWYLPNGIEQQGHGNGTIAILAGGKLDFLENNITPRSEYFGGFPFAKVVTLRISDSVAILCSNQFSDALNYAVNELKADVVSMSMAGLPSKKMANAINNAYEKGTIVITAAGNTWDEGAKEILPDKIMYPAKFDRVVAVTGATLYHTPYQIKPNEGWESLRAPGGKYMQSCHGPAEAMRTAIAAYTPNVLWFGYDKPPYFSFSGGGTSSATPQVAAAAALYIHKHRKEAVLQNRDWKRTETVRQAIFRSADKNFNGKYGSLHNLNGNNFDQYFGNGLLKAFDALQIHPSSIVLTDAHKEKKANLGWFQIDDIVKTIFGIRGNSTRKEIIYEMVGLEIEQLLYTDPALMQYIGETSLSQDMKEKIYNSKYASSTLKQAIGSQLAQVPIEQRGSFSMPSVAKNFLLEDQSHITIQVDHVGANMRKLVDNKNASSTLLTSIEVDIYMNEVRSSGQPQLQIINKNIDHDENQILVIEKDANGKENYYWVSSSDNEESSINKSRGIKINNGNIIIPLNQNRGVGDTIKKYIVSVIKTLKDEALSDYKGLIKAEIGVGEIQWQELNKIKDSKKLFGKNKKVLLFIHGTFSSVESSFCDLFKNRKFDDYIYNEYDIVLGYNHSTIKSGIQKNVQELKKAILTYGIDEANLTVITASRGGLIARSAFTNPKTRMILSACPNSGTPMADKEHITSLTGRLAKLTIAKFGISSPILGLLAQAVHLASKELWSMPGLEDMAPESTFISGLPMLNISTNIKLIGVNHNSTGLKTFVDIANDNLIFEGEENDMVVGFKTATDHLSSNSFYIKSSSVIHHLNYFENDEIVDFLMNNI